MYSQKQEPSQIQDLMSNSIHPTKEHLNYPIKHAYSGSHRIPFMSVHNPAHDDPLSHYHSIAHELQEILVPAISVVLQKLGVTKDNADNADKGNPTDPTDPDKSILISMDVHQFSPEELTVKMKGDELVIEGKHEDKHDGHGFISRNVIRRIYIPNGIDKTTISCDVNSEGILDISVPKPKPEGDDLVEKSLPIHFQEKPAAGLESDVHRNDQHDQHDQLQHAGEKRHYQQEAWPVPDLAKALSKAQKGA